MISMSDCNHHFCAVVITMSLVDFRAVINGQSNLIEVKKLAYLK